MISRFCVIFKRMNGASIHRMRNSGRGPDLKGKVRSLSLGRLSTR